MTTRGLIGFIYRGISYYVFNSYDSYYSYLGLLILKELINMLKNNQLNEWLNKFNSLKIVNANDEISDEDLLLLGCEKTVNSDYKYCYGDDIIEYKLKNGDAVTTFETVLNHKYLLSNFKPIHNEVITSENRSCPPYEYIYIINFDTCEFITITQFEDCNKYSLNNDNIIQVLEELKQEWKTYRE